MDKIWYRNPLKSEVIGRCGGDEKTNDHAEPTKVKKHKKRLCPKKKVSVKAVIVISELSK